VKFQPQRHYANAYVSQVRHTTQRVALMRLIANPDDAWQVVGDGLRNATKVCCVFVWFGLVWFGLVWFVCLFVCLSVCLLCFLPTYIVYSRCISMSIKLLLQSFAMQSSRLINKASMSRFVILIILFVLFFPFTFNVGCC
jgi:hypothetical protein